MTSNKIEDFCSLVPIGIEHLRFVHENMNDNRIVDTYPVTIPYSSDEAEQYIINEIKQRGIGNRYAFIIKYNDVFAGLCALYDVDRNMKSAKLYYWIAVKFWNRGVATEAVKKIKDYAFNSFNIQQLQTGVLVRNIASVNVLKRCGFIIDKEIVNTGQYHDKFIDQRFYEMSTCKDSILTYM
ncbi:MAG: GNAT family N-acetyltransferase [Bacteroidales bacterium]|nr:GNAT family N-acetyltransferase [Bacteroidales bacterium]